MTHSIAAGRLTHSIAAVRLTHSIAAERLTHSIAAERLIYLIAFRLDSLALMRSLGWDFIIVTAIVSSVLASKPD